MTLDEIRELIRVVTDTGVSELEVQRGDERVRIRRGGTRKEVIVPEPADFHRAAQVPHVNSVPPAAQTVPAAIPPTSPVPPDVMADPSLVIVKAPIVGTFYEAPSPDAPTFVKVGDNVQPGKVICIIESMKLMNEIEAEVAGTVVAKLVANAQAVEYGESLFAIRPF